MKIALLGNHQSIRCFQHETASNYDLIVTVNAGMKYLAEIDVRADIFWCQDKRLFTEKSSVIFPYVSSIGKAYALSSTFYPSVPYDFLKNFEKVEYLGNLGWSDNVRFGLYTGYNSIYGALQLVNSLHNTLQEIDIYGVSMNYIAGGRFYQSKRTFHDLDLHRQGEQIECLDFAIDRLSSCDISINFVGCGYLFK